MTSLHQTSFDSVPERPEEPPAGSEPDVEAATTANLLAGLGARLRAAYEQGARLEELAVACHQPVAVVRRLLAAAGADLSSELRPEPRPVPRIRRPVPSRRLRQLHPPAAREPKLPTPVVEPTAPLGVVLGASPGHSESGSGGGRQRVTAELVRLGRGTSLVVLPAWRAAIAVSVPTEQLLAETGLEYERLTGARLTVLINLEALHDRELLPTDWRAETRRVRGPY